MNFTAGQAVAHSLIVPVGPDGRITLRIRPTPPNSSHLNWTKGETVSNLVLGTG
ncbi:hypothetical protein [Streptomyces sp. NPDC005533]|uniref:hypothetical protein n=1 Tax=Streptomyces sp. NPDC005533 TaxID=3364723 RepID=UPI0036CC6565